MFLTDKDTIAYAKIFYLVIHVVEVVANLEMLSSMSLCSLLVLIRNDKVVDHFFLQQNGININTSMVNYLQLWLFLGQDWFDGFLCFFCSQNRRSHHEDLALHLPHLQDGTLIHYCLSLGQQHLTPSRKLSSIRDSRDLVHLFLSPRL